MERMSRANQSDTLCGRDTTGWIMVSVSVLCLLLITTVAPAEAYNDPGSGLLLWQLIVSGFVGCVLFRFKKIVRFLKRDSKQKEK